MPRHVKRSRRKKAELATLKQELYSIIALQRPMTVRQVFYAGSTRNLYPKTEKSYHLVKRELTKMRKEGMLPFEWLVDNTRWVAQVNTYSGIEEVLGDAHLFYRRDLWRDNDELVEIWLEKDALRSVIAPITEQYGAPLYTTKGYASLSYLWHAAMSLDTERRTYIYFFGDYDPSGVDIPVKVEETLREYSDADFEFIRVAVNPEQIEALELPTRPTKRSDSRSVSFGAESVELDAIPPATLRSMVKDVIRQHLDLRRVELLRATEAEERQWLQDLHQRFSGGTA